jgi:hypothetical protein
MAELAKTNYNTEEDYSFYGYLDRLVNNEEYIRSIKFNGK